jgi:hypothetical protein
MRIASVVVPALAIFAPLAAPAFGQAGPGTGPSQSCPIQFQMKQQQGLIAHRAAEIKGRANGQALEFRFARLNPSPIASADITVYGITQAPGGQVLPPDKKPPEIAETLHLTPTPQSSRVAIADVWTTKVRVVSWAEVTQIRYTDGSVWHKSDASHCNAALDLLVLTSL